MNYLKIDKEDVCNGDGLRVVLWLSGCSHHCYNCQNPQTWDPNSGILFDDTAKEELFRELNKDYISGLTLTGGDPLYESNLSEIYQLCEDFKKLFPNKTIWLYSGWTWEEIYNKDYTVLEKHFTLRQAIVAQCDVFIDGEYIEEQRDITLKWVGSSNQRVIDVRKSLEKGEVVLYEN